MCTFKKIIEFTLEHDWNVIGVTLKYNLHVYFKWNRVYIELWFNLHLIYIGMTMEWDLHCRMYSTSEWDWNGIYNTLHNNVTMQWKRYLQLLQPDIYSTFKLYNNGTCKSTIRYTKQIDIEHTSYTYTTVDNVIVHYKTQIES